MLTLIRCAFVLLALCTAAPLAAQRRPTFSLEGSLGVGTGSGGGERVQRTATVIDGLVAWRARTAAAGGLIIAANGMWQGRHANNDICVIQQSGLCVPVYPSFTTMGLLGGWERARGYGASARILAGPELFVRELGAGSVGLTGRIDLGTPSRGGVALIASGRVGVTSDDGETYTLSAITFGLRIH